MDLRYIDFDLYDSMAYTTLIPTCLDLRYIDFDLYDSMIYQQAINDRPIIPEQVIPAPPTEGLTARAVSDIIVKEAVGGVKDYIDAALHAQREESEKVIESATQQLEHSDEDVP